MRSRFHQELDELRARLLRMGGLAEQAVDRACQAYIDRDLKRCHMVLEGETQINLVEREIDEMSFDLLAMQQPMAVDLRFILAVSKINADLERVGDQAVNIAERVMDMVELPKVDLPVDIPRMATAVSAMVRRALESFIEGKAELAQAVLEMVLKMGQTLEGAQSSSPALISQLVGFAVERMALEKMDPNAPFGTNGQTNQDELNRIAQTRQTIDDLDKQTQPLLKNLTDQDWVVFANRRMLFGEVPAMQWVLSKYGQQQ